MIELPRLLALSRQGASAPWRDGLQHAHYRQAQGPGVRLRASCEGVPVAFWVPEPEWCHWLSPLLPVPNLSALAQDWQAAAAAWTLAVLEPVWQALALPLCREAQLDAAPAPDSACWCLCFEAAGRRLPLYIEVLPGEWLMRWLSTMSPPDIGLNLPLGIGWCAWPPGGAQLGDALPVLAAAEALDVFWLDPLASPGRVQLLSPDRLQVVDSMVPAMPDDERAGWLAVEVGQVQLAAQDVWPWQAGKIMAVQSAANPLVRLSSARGVVAQGGLLQWQQGWAVCLAGTPAAPD
ncbi:hypothetical protein THUN1379_26830 [Paludibacterium sp. THUN1379]|uniref:hypothetical protein n=1 Tax=Paludibacterium sp. THUN1379 TaxID=3112107 RepID=UPI00308CBE2A|nr:hypothetical protein THUN1379_26830 [Paludibacterium sp. THUN1379]